MNPRRREQQWGRYRSGTGDCGVNPCPRRGATEDHGRTRGGGERQDLPGVWHESCALSEPSACRVLRESSGPEKYRRSAWITLQSGPEASPVQAAKSGSKRRRACKKTSEPALAQAVSRFQRHQRGSDGILRFLVRDASRSRPPTRSPHTGGTKRISARRS
jgi:hypothetical protein